MNGFFHILISKPLFSLKSPTKFEKNTVKPPLTAASQQRPNSLRCFVFGNIIHNFLSICTFRCFSKIRRNGSHFPWWRSQRKTRRPWVTSSSGKHLRKLDWSPQLMNRSAKCLRVMTSYNGWLICQRVPWLRSTNIFSHHKTNSLVHQRTFLNHLFSCFIRQETFWRIPTRLNPERLRMAAKDLEGTGTGDNEEGRNVHLLILPFLENFRPWDSCLVVIKSERAFE